MPSSFVSFENKHTVGGTISLTIPKLKKNEEEGLVSPHWLVTTRISPSFPFSKTNIANIHSESNPMLSITGGLNKEFAHCLNMAKKVLIDFVKDFFEFESKLKVWKYLFANWDRCPGPAKRKPLTTGAGGGLSNWAWNKTIKPIAIPFKATRFLTKHRKLIFPSYQPFFPFKFVLNPELPLATIGNGVVFLLFFFQAGMQKWLPFC